MEFNKNTIKSIILILFASILFYLGVQNIAVIAGVIGEIFSLIFPFILGAMVAFIINVPMSRIEHWLFKEKNLKGKRAISFAITMVAVVGVISIAVYIIVPQLATTLQSIARQLPDAYRATEDWISKNFSFLEDYINQITVDWDMVVRKVSTLLQSVATTMVNSGIGVVSNIIGAVVNFFIGLVFAIYILVSKEKLNRQGKQIVFAVFREEIAEKILYVLSLSQKTFSKFISGQCLEACILGIMFFVTMSIFKMPYAMLISVLIAFTALIPMVGAFIGCVIGIILILMISPVKAFMFLLMFLILQQIEGNLVYPHVVGNSVGLPSIWVLVAITIGGKLMGIAGMIIFIPFVSVIYSLFRLYIKERLAKKGIPEEKWLNRAELTEDVMKKSIKKQQKSKILKE